jgi:hypothetical protein
MFNPVSFSSLLQGLPVYSFNNTFYYWSGIVYKVIRISHDKLIEIIMKYKKNDNKFIPQSCGGIDTFLISHEGFLHIVKVLIPLKHRAELVKYIKSCNSNAYN